jgi:exonuclease V gamma subunit
VYADDDYLNTNVNTIMFNWKWKIFPDVIVVWDNYIRRWNDSQLATLQGIVPSAENGGNATFTSSRITFVVSF